MVRVISVHHFAGQDIQTVEQPTACTIAFPDKLLLALTNNCIEVRDLKSQSDLLFTFPSVDEVIQIVHSQNGDFVATLETKFNRQNKDTNFVRVYINWDSVATLQQSKMTSSGISLGASECGMVQPMRARIAGRVTPTTNQSELGNLEMIEIPVKRNPNSIACCQISGNLFILANKTITLFNFKVKNHDISKMKFIDFEEAEITLELPFSPYFFDACENFIACLSKECAYLFEMVEGGGAKGDHSDHENGFSFEACHDATIDYSQLATQKKQTLVHLPTITRDNSTIHKNSPFTITDKELQAKSNTPKITIKNLIQLRLIPIVIEHSHRPISEQFTSLILKPMYTDTGCVQGHHPHSSPYRSSLHGVVCMVATQQEGYLHYFNRETSDDAVMAVYPFTAPVHNLVMEDYFLHALTETGLETYTLRIGHAMFKCLEGACPSLEDAVCLVGLRPFLGVERILLGHENLVLMSSSDSSPAHSVSSNSSSTASYWTLYNLELPTPKTVFNDVSIVADVHRFTSPSTYCHLMSEAHVILRMALYVKQWKVTEDQVKLVIGSKANVDVETFRVSCGLLGDHYIMCPHENGLAIAYYKMARIPPGEVLKRVKQIQDQSNNNTTIGVLNYLKHTLLEVRHSHEADKLFSGGSTKQNVLETILHLFEKHSFKDLPNLILKNQILREYSTDRLIKILLTAPSNPQIELALTLLYVQKCNSAKARLTLAKIPKTTLLDLITANCDLVVVINNQGRKNTAEFTEFAVLLINSQPRLLSEAMASLITEKKYINLNKLIKIFLDYLPSSIGSDSSEASKVLQWTLEAYFAHVTRLKSPKTLSERGANEALKLLVRSYLSQLFQLKDERGNVAPLKTNEDYFFTDSPPDCSQSEYIFAGVRFAYLDKMAPFQVEITSRLYEASVDHYRLKSEVMEHAAGDLVLRKLQAVLSSGLVSKQVMGEVNAFVLMHDALRGVLSLQSLVLGNHDAVQLLIGACPQCLLQFGKDRFSKVDEWKFLISVVQKQILKLSHDEQLNRVCFFYKKLLKDILTHVATSMTLDQLVQVFPQRFSDNKNELDLLNLDDELDLLNEIQNYEPFVMICKETMHANQIKKLIHATGQQLLCSLNL